MRLVCFQEPLIGTTPCRAGIGRFTCKKAPVLMEVPSVIIGPKVHTKSSQELPEQFEISQVYVLIAIFCTR